MTNKHPISLRCLPDLFLCRPMTAYFLWLQENRESIKKANPNASVTEISKLAGVEWGKLSASDKKKYEDAAAKDKARYEKEMAAYKKSA